MPALHLLVIFGVLRDRQELRYTLDAQGAHEQTAGPLKHINIVRLLPVLSGKPTYAGIGMITRGPVSERVTSRRVEKVIPEPQAKMIALSWVRSHVGQGSPHVTSPLAP